MYCFIIYFNLYPAQKLSCCTISKGRVGRCKCQTKQILDVCTQVSNKQRGRSLLSTEIYFKENVVVYFLLTLRAARKFDLRLLWMLIRSGSLHVISAMPAVMKRTM